MAPAPFLFKITFMNYICYKCKSEKELNNTNFYVSSTNTIGFEHICKKCRNRNRWPITDDKEVIIKFRKAFREKYSSNKTWFIVKSYKQYDKKKGYKTELSDEFISKCLSEECAYCGFPSTGLDRKDNLKGHTEENCVPCCKECNIARMNNFTHEEMFEIGKAIKKIKDNRTQ